MLCTKYKNCTNILKNSHQILNNSKCIRCLSSAETLEPVKLSYATYESTISGPRDYIPPLIIMHGLFGSKSNWNTLCKAYQQKTFPQRKIIAIDARNHGDSAHYDNHTYAHLAADIRALFDQLNITTAALMGHSMGGRAVMLFALKYPELVERLIVADISPITTSPNLYTMPSLFQALDTVNLPSDVTLSQARALVDLQLSDFIPEKSLRSFLLGNLIQETNGRYNWRVNIPVLLSNFNNIARFPLVNDLQYKGPVIFLGGSKSDYLQKSDYPKILKLFPNAELKYIDGAGHWLHSEKPSEFLKLTLDFLNKKAVNS